MPNHAGGQSSRTKTLNPYLCSRELIHKRMGSRIWATVTGTMGAGGGDPTPHTSNPQLSTQSPPSPLCRKLSQKGGAVEFGERQREPREWAEGLASQNPQPRLSTQNPQPQPLQQEAHSKVDGQSNLENRTTGVSGGPQPSTQTPAAVKRGGAVEFGERQREPRGGPRLVEGFDIPHPQLSTSNPQLQPLQQEAHTKVDGQLNGNHGSGRRTSTLEEWWDGAGQWVSALCLHLPPFLSVSLLSL